MKTDFHSQYEVLGLSATADWPTVQSTYRKLVHKWHPDRHRNSSVSEAQAEQRFIRFTRAFNILRDFYRTNHRLPLQGATTSGDNSDPATPATGNYSRARPRTAVPQVSDKDLQGSSILNHSERSPTRVQTDTKALVKNRYITSSILLLTMLTVTAGLMVALDAKSVAVSRQKARDVLISQRPSKFLRSAQEFRRASSTGAFIETPPALASQSSGDSFLGNR